MKILQCNKSKGLNQVATVVTLMIIGIAAVTLTYSPIRSYITAIYKREAYQTGVSELRIIGVKHEAGQIKSITVKNLGPEKIVYQGKSQWQIVIDDEVRSVASVMPPSGTIKPGETIEIVIENGVSYSESHLIKVYGPRGIEATASYSPKG